MSILTKQEGHHPSSAVGLELRGGQARVFHLGRGWPPRTSEAQGSPSMAAAATPLGAGKDSQNSDGRRAADQLEAGSASRPSLHRQDGPLAARALGRLSHQAQGRVLSRRTMSYLAQELGILSGVYGKGMLPMPFFSGKGVILLPSPP